MQVAKITKVNINPPQSNEFIVEVYWRYPGEVPYRTANDNVTCNADGTFQVPVNITYDDAVNNSIEIRILFQGCPTTVPFEYTHSGTTTTTSTVAASGNLHLLTEEYSFNGGEGITGICEINGFSLQRSVAAAEDSTAANQEVDAEFMITTDNGISQTYLVRFDIGQTRSHIISLDNSGGGNNYCSSVTEVYISNIQIV